MSIIMEHNSDTRKMPDEERTLPEHCPSWCQTNHQRMLDEALTREEACQHWSSAGDGSLSDLRNLVDKRLWREGGGGWSLYIEQDPHPTSNTGTNGEPLVRLDVHDKHYEHLSAMLTTGEARVLAAQLLRAADRVDLDD